MAPSTLIYDRNGRLLYEIMDPHGGKNQPVPLHEIPIHLQQATIATEDATFYENPGVDPLAIVRAISINLRGGEIISGGSTITQQVARNLLLPTEERLQRTLTRKIRESVLAYRLARSLSKDDILQLYLNTVYYGNLSYGVEAASRTYFGKSVGELDLAECTLLAGLPQAPAIHDPLVNPQQAKERQDTVLQLMVKAGYISAEQARAAAAESLSFAASPFPIRAPHFVMYVWELLRRQLGEAELHRGGLRVYTTLDLDLQNRAREIACHHLTQLATPGDGEPSHNVSNAALVAIDPRSGEILAMLGSPDYFDASIDGAVNVSLMPRQPGSAIKPLTYAAAFGQDYTPATMLLDVPTAFTTRQGDSYVPVNYDHTYHGPVLLREALGSSLNVIAVQVLQHIGIDELVGLCHRLGMTTLQDPERYGLALTLGGGEVRLLELTAAYSTLATGGLRVEPRAVLRVEQQDGQMWEPETASAQRVIEDYVAFWVTDVLADNGARIAAFGESSALVLTRPAAVKTGTTTDWRDNWTVGYTPQLVVGVWVGNADNSPMINVSGVCGAAPIWNEFMEQALRSQPVEQFLAPAEMIQVEICADSGMLAGPDCPHRRYEWFVPGREPRVACTMHRRVFVDRRNGELATDATPAEYVIEQTEMLLPPEAAQWVQEYAGAANARLAIGHETASDPASAVQEQALRLTSPSADSTYRIAPDLPAELQRIEIEALPVGIPAAAQITIYVDSNRIGVLEHPPYTLMWQLQAGEHTLHAQASMPSGESWSSEPVRISVLQ
jgi:1A family penicillin-binding protein